MLAGTGRTLKDRNIFAYIEENISAKIILL